MTQEEYREYLASQEWWDRRTKVFERANGLCEGCRCEEPVDVHHLTYDHVGQEFLWELVALCAPCHARIHGGTGQSKRAENRQQWTRRKTETEKYREGMRQVLRHGPSPQRPNRQPGEDEGFEMPPETSR